MKYQDRLLKVIPGGAHTYSRGFDQFPSNAPPILQGGKGVYTFDNEGNRFLDYGMALRAVNIGYAEDSVNRAAIKQIELGNNLTRPSFIELEAAELMVSLIGSVDMVKFTKNGSTATTAAVKLARGYTGRTLIGRCVEHPFLSYDDWFIGSTPLSKGVDADSGSKTKYFNYNNIESLEKLIDQYPKELACVIIEPATIEHPSENFLHKVQALCEKNGIVFILDEMITGFRWHLKGAQYFYEIKPDLCTFGKAMSNGFSVAAVAGRREIMEIGSIEFEGRERLFLLSTTHGAEMCGLGAFVETVKFIQDNNVINHIWNYGKMLIAMMNEASEAVGLEKHFISGGIECSPYYLTFNNEGQLSLPLRTLFVQEMIKHGVLIPWIALAYRHGDKELEVTRNALYRSLNIYKKALEEGVEKYLSGHTIKPVFRKYN